MLALVLVAVTGIALAICVLLLWPFASGFTWALALAIVSAPIHRWVEGRVSGSNLPAAITCGIVVLALLLPAVLVSMRVVSQASAGFNKFIDQPEPLPRLESIEAADPRLAPLVAWARTNVDWERELKQLREWFDGMLTKFVGGMVATGINIFIAVVLLFYFIRDRKQALGMVRYLLPVSDKEASLVMKRVTGMIESTLHGTLFVAAIQGFLGGLMFWILGLPAPMLWGVVMGLLSIIPVLGAFVVWIPAAAYLGSQGAWTKAIILVAWGSIVVGLVDNWLFPILVGKNTRMHTAPVFVAIIGGLALFGAAGLVLGPMALALAWALLEVLRNRTIRNDGAIDQQAH